MSRSEEILMMGGPIILEEIPTGKKTGKTEKFCNADPENLKLLCDTGRNFAYRHVKKRLTRRGKDDEIRKAV